VVPPNPRELSPLALAALALLGDGATAGALKTRCAEAGADLQPGVPEALLTELADLGLVRVARRTEAGPHFVPTTLGQHRAGAVLPAGERRSLAELEQLRTDLLSTIAHELRTPLTAIRISAGLLLDPGSRPTPEQQETLLRTIERNAERMQRITGDILELARFRSGNVSLQRRQFDAGALAEAAIASVLPLVTQRGQRLELVVEPTPLRVYGDHRRLEQALVNLVSNAQRFSTDGGVVRVAVRSEDQDVAWSVTDDGPGIAPEDQERLFERFFVARTDRGGTREGVGLGLPTALAIAQAHGGTIRVVSRPGEGSTFTLTVPLAGPAGDANGEDE
jgi:signal transduction histidine kinase